MSRAAPVALAAAALAAAACGDGGPEPAPRPQPAPAATQALADTDGWFRDVTPVSGVDFVHRTADGAMDNLVESVGAGVTCLDYDGDGRQDLYFVAQAWREGVSSGRPPAGPPPRNRLYRNLGGGRFEDVTDRAGVGDSGFGTMALPFDSDDDGLVDLYVLNVGPNRLWRNRGDGTFEDATARAGVAGDACSVAGAAFDADGDGDLDLYVGNYVAVDPDYRLYYKPDVFPGPLAYAAQADVLYVNRGDGTFEDGTAGSGLDVPPARAMGVSVLDADGDGRADLYVANDASANFLFLSRGGGRFEERAVETGCAYGVVGDATASMAAMVGDVNEDGRPDLHVTDSSYGSLLLSTPTGFVDRGLRSGIGAACGQWASWGGGFLDYDADGHLDLYVADGDLHRATGRPDVLLRGRGDGTFDDVSADAGPWFRRERCGRAACLVDFDSDGRLDVVVTHVDDRPALLHADPPSGGRFAAVALVPRSGNAGGQGTKVTLRAGGRTFSQTAWPRHGYLSVGDPRLFFGLGDAPRIERLEVVWPDGTREEATDLEAGRIRTFRQGEGGQ